MPKKEESFFRETIRFALITLAIVLPIRIFIAEPFIVSGASMEPTFYTGDYLIIDQLSYHFEEPRRGEVVVFRYPYDPAKFFIKRIIALPGESINVEGEKTIIRTSSNPEGVLLVEPYTLGAKYGNYAKTLKDDEYFVMGDNRSASSDSRNWGPLEKKYIIGRAFFRAIPLSKAGLFPGKIKEPL